MGGAEIARRNSSITFLRAVRERARAPLAGTAGCDNGHPGREKLYCLKGCVILNVVGRFRASQRLIHELGAVRGQPVDSGMLFEPESQLGTPQRPQNRLLFVCLLRFATELLEQASARAHAPVPARSFPLVCIVQSSTRVWQAIPSFCRPLDWDKRASQRLSRAILQRLSKSLFAPPLLPQFHLKCQGTCPWWPQSAGASKIQTRTVSQMRTLRVCDRELRTRPGSAPWRIRTQKRAIFVIHVGRFGVWTLPLLHAVHQWCVATQAERGAAVD